MKKNVPVRRIISDQDIKIISSTDGDINLKSKLIKKLEI